MKKVHRGESGQTKNETQMRRTLTNMASFILEIDNDIELHERLRHVRSGRRVAST